MSIERAARETAKAIDSAMHGDTIKPSHYLHPTIPGLEARHVIENYPYHIATAIAYLWRCGRKEGVDPLDDLRKAKMHLEFELERYRNNLTLHYAERRLSNQEVHRIVEPFSLNIASALYFLIGRTPLPSIVQNAIRHIDFELERLQHEQ